MLACLVTSPHVRLVPTYISQVMNRHRAIKNQKLSDAESEVYPFTLKLLRCRCPKILGKALVYRFSDLSIDVRFLGTQAVRFRSLRILPATWVLRKNVKALVPKYALVVEPGVCF